LSYTGKKKLHIFVWPDIKNKAGPISSFP